MSSPSSLLWPSDCPGGIARNFGGSRLLSPLTTAEQPSTPPALVRSLAELAQELGLFERNGESATISSRAGKIKGKLVRATTTLVADEGESIEVDSTVFVSSDWPEGNFIGYSGFLERIRFAIDPRSNSFVFGAR